MSGNEPLLEAELSGWTKQYSKSRQRDYYFNSQTGESLWTLEEVKDRLRKSNAPTASNTGASKSKPETDQTKQKLKSSTKNTQSLDDRPTSSASVLSTSKLSKNARPKSSKTHPPTQHEVLSPPIEK